MLIISKSHDYYDSVGKSKGVDKTIIYKRKEKVIRDERTQKAVRDLRLLNFSNTLRHYTRKRNALSELSFRMIIVGFCGKFYPVVIRTSYKFDDVTKISQPEYIYDTDLIDQLIEETRHNFFFKTTLHDYKERIASTHFKHLYESFKCPIVIFGSPRGIQEDIVILNPLLKEINFMKVVDPYTAFQEIEMYISGALGAPPKPMVFISDKDRLLAHGFDAKTSFRKPKKDKRSTK